MSIYERECPRCAEIVKRKAQVCRYCGHEFEDWEAQRRQIEEYEVQDDAWQELNDWLQSCGSSDALTGDVDVVELREHLFGLTELDLRESNITHLPESIGQLTKLLWLDLSENNLISLPESIGSLIGLTELVLDGNNLTSLPESIGKLTGLYELDLSENNLTSLPESIGQLTALDRVHLYGNDLLKLSKEVVSPNVLIRLDFTLIERFCLHDSLPIQSITWVVPKDTSIEILQTQIEQCLSLNNIHYIVFLGNELNRIPENIGRLTSLTALHLSGQPLTHLSPAMKQQLLVWDADDNFGLYWDGEVKRRLVQERQQAEQRRRQAEQRKKQLLIAAVVLPVIFWLLFS